MAALNAGALAAIVAVMQAHVGVAAVSETGCRALGNIACEFAAGQQNAVDAGALAAIVAAMQAHVHDTGVCELGCLALGNIVLVFSSAGRQLLMLVLSWLLLQQCGRT